jgi:hypothetical protein
MQPTQYSTPACDGRGRRPSRSKSPQWSVDTVRTFAGVVTTVPSNLRNGTIKRSPPARTHTTQLLQASSSPLQKATSRAPRCSAGRSASGSALLVPKLPKAQAEPNGFRRGAHERTQQRHVVGECRGGGRRHTRLHASTPTDAESDRKPEDARAVFINATRSAQHATLHSVTNGARSAAQRIRRPVCLPVGIAAGGKALRCSERLTATTGLGFSRYLGTPRGMARAAHRWARPHAPLCGAGRDGIRAQTPPPDGWYCEYFEPCARLSMAGSFALHCMRTLRNVLRVGRHACSLHRL